MIASTNSEKRINWYYWQTNRKKTFFRHSIVMKACISLSCIRFCFIFKIFFIVDWFEIKSFFSYYCWLYPWLYYVFLAIHHLFLKKKNMYFVSSKRFTFPLSFETIVCRLTYPSSLHPYIEPFYQKKFC